MNRDREECIKILKENVKSDSLIKHALAVESVMRQFAKVKGEDENLWGNIGLLHDIDYEKYPEEHCQKCIEILKSYNFDEKYIDSIRSHGYQMCTDVKPELYMEKVLYTIDELTGLIIATALMKPSKKIKDVDVNSINKKFKSKGFAAKVNRDVIKKGSEMLGEELEYIFEQSLIALQGIAVSIEL